MRDKAVPSARDGLRSPLERSRRWSNGLRGRRTGKHIVIQPVTRSQDLKGTDPRALATAAA